MFKKSDIRSIVGSAICGVLISLAIACCIIIHYIYETDQRAKEGVTSQTTPLQMNNAPIKSQASIVQALEYFKIALPSGVNIPAFDPELTDRGITMRRGPWNAPEVSIGPDAFASWSLLGSTLAHELEVHCKQNFVAIHLMNLAGADGTGFAEREAYGYEIKNSKRFGLSPYDQDLIRSTVLFYYPQSRFVVTQIPSIKFLMAKLSILDSNPKSLR